ncbi:MAG TPA: TAXI family TRAP transporter solute-binding subunit [Beijerinckiaceae bacterium]|nr:TAXI family TRAP transporter solute-binding subunit [Beijerinckiaceae bacterium]
MARLVRAAALAALCIWPHLAVAQPLGLGTSPQATLTYAIGAAVSKVLAEKASMQSRVQPSSGTGAMIPLVNSGEIDVGFCNTQELYDAFHGVGTFDKRPNPKLRAVGVLFPIRVGLFVRNDSPIRSVKDLKGRTITYGYTSQEIIRTTIDAMLATAGLSINDMRPVLVPNLIRGVDELISGRADVSTFAIGTAKVAEADAAVGIRYLPLDDAAASVSAMQKWFPVAYMGKVEPAPHLPGVREPIMTMHYDYTVFANADLPVERVKTITRVIAENKETLSQSLPAFRDMNPGRLYNKIKVPFHDGALAYFRDKGIEESQ